MSKILFALLAGTIVSWSVHSAHAQDVDPKAALPLILGSLERASYAELSAADMERTVGTQGNIGVEVMARAYAQGERYARTRTDTTTRVVEKRDETIMIGTADASAEAAGRNPRAIVYVSARAVGNDDDGSTIVRSYAQTDTIQKEDHVFAVGHAKVIVIIRPSGPTHERRFAHR